MPPPDDYQYDDRRPVRRADAARRTAAPGLLLLLFGLLGLFIEAASLAAAFTNPTVVHDTLKRFAEGQPPSPQRDDLLKQLREGEAGMRLDTPGNIGFSAFGALLNLLMVVGGLKMRAVNGYGLSVAGAIAGLIPVSGCVCCAMPVGLWALIVLLNGDVKAAFDRSAPPADDYDRGIDR